MQQQEKHKSAFFSIVFRRTLFLVRIYPNYSDYYIAICYPTIYTNVPYSRERICVSRIKGVVGPYILYLFADYSTRQLLKIL